MLKHLRLILLFIPFTLCSQDQNIGFHFGYEMASAKIKSQKVNLIGTSLQHNGNTEIHYRIELKKYLLLESGLNHTVHAVIYNPQNQYIINNQIVSIQVENRFSYLRIPLKVGVQSNTKFNLYFVPGVIFNFITNCHRTIISNSVVLEQENTQGDLNRFTCSLQYELGFSFRFKKRFEIFVTGNYWHDIIWTRYPNKLSFGYLSSDPIYIKFSGMNANIGMRFQIG